jgi:hypothetical protein
LLSVAEPLAASEVHEQTAADCAEPYAKNLLHNDDALNCAHLVTVEQKRIRRIVGRLPAPLMEQIGGYLKVALVLL